MDVIKEMGCNRRGKFIGYINRLWASYVGEEKQVKN
jgi:hypothetical protein